MSEYKKRYRWLGRFNPYSIGGRDTDISEIGNSLDHQLRDYFGDALPLEIEIKLQPLKDALKSAESKLDSFIEFVSDYAKENKS